MTVRHSLLRRALTGLALLAAVLVAAPYAWGPVYRFPEPGLFAGSRLWNPYEDLSPTWQRANLHAHGRAWMGLTNGQQSDAEIVARYRQLGYDVPGVSDYQRIAAKHGIDTMPIYEHGFNITKQHQLAIGARDVAWLDFLLWQSRSHQQEVINRVKQTADLVALAHPGSRDAYTPADLQWLTGYDLIEVVNGPFAATDVWDAALSSGHAVWAVANDDTHDLTDPRRTAAGWNMIGAATSDPREIVDALRAGRTYAVLRTGALGAANVTVVDHVRVQNGTVSVSVTGAASTFRFIGQNGVLRKTIRAATEADYTFTDADTYVRTVVESPQTTLYLNPVIRYEGAALPAPKATVDIASTWTLRGSVGLGCVLLGWAYTRRRRPVRVLVPRPLIAADKRKTA